MSDPAWAVVPFVNRWDLTELAIRDLLAQEGCEMRVLVVGNGCSLQDRLRMDAFVMQQERVLPWYCQPMMSLSAVWNAGLRFVWEQGFWDALVCNNDIRVTQDTYMTLVDLMQETGAFLVTATGVEGEEGLFEEAKDVGQAQLAWTEHGTICRGGPGFSCFLVGREGHEKYPFDENLYPAFCEDLDLHRRIMLGGDGDRAFGSNVRYLHLGGMTLKSMSPEQREAHEHMVSANARVYYSRKWGGGANEETYWAPFNADIGPAGLSPQWPGADCGTMKLFDLVREGWKK